jgi:dipeptidyl aminopeptidase/acylaminoacyl peptidase
MKVFPPVFSLTLATLLIAGSSGAEIIPVGYGDLPPGPLAPAEQERLQGLLGVKYPQVLSTLSPDGSTLVVAFTSPIDPNTRQIYFLDVRQGRLTPAPALENELVDPVLPLRWLDRQTLRAVQQDVFGPWEMITLNRRSGLVSRTQIYPQQEESGEILGLSPDFSQLVIRLYEGETDGVYRILLPSLERLEIARLPRGVGVQAPVWSAQGQGMALVITAAEEAQLYQRSPTNPSLASSVMQDALGRLAPQDNPLHQQNQVRWFDLTAPQGAPVSLAMPADDRDGWGAASLSPDGEQLLVKRYRPAQVQGRPYPTYAFPESAYYQVYDRQGQLQATIDAPPLQGPIESQGQFLDSDRLLFWAATGLDRHLFIYHLQRQELQPLPLPSGTVDPRSLTPSADGNTLIYGFSSVTQVPELFSLDTRAGKKPQALTQINQGLAGLNQVRADRVSFTIPPGDRPGLLIQPAGRSFPPAPGPVILWQEGGPGFAMANQFGATVESPLNLLPNFGLPVLVVPLSGREGFGPAFYRRLADQENFGQLDITEGALVIEQMVQRGWAGAGQVGVTGCSYGGYYSAQLISRFPRLVAAANPQCSLLDTLTEWQLGYGALLAYLVGQTPMEAPQRYQRDSPLYQATAIRTPTLLFHGAEDFLQLAVVRNFHDVIAAAGVPVTLYEFEGLGHSLIDPEFQYLAAQLQVAFFRQYLQPTSALPPVAPRAGSGG